jgi:hypothetical protein
MLGIGCAALPRGAEPGVIVVRNTSGRDVASVTLAPSGDSADGISRSGSLSPLPRGVQQVVVRPSHAPPLASEVEFRWTETGGRVRAVTLDLEPTLRAARGGPGEALVFELLPGGRVATRVEAWPR